MSQFNSLSPEFRDSLRKAIDNMAKKAEEKKAACGGCPGMNGMGSPDKESKIGEVLSNIGRFNDRVIKEWLYSLDGESLEEVDNFFKEINDLSATELVLLMRASGAPCPWKLIADMFTMAEKAQAETQGLQGATGV